MLSVQQATDIIFQHSLPLPDEQVALTNACGRILREPLLADRDFPPFDRVTMDGIAIQHEAFAAGRRNFLIENIGAAGAPQQSLLNSNNCIEIMTGAVLPAQTDTVIRYEDVTIDKGTAQIELDTVRAGQNVHKQATDRTKGELIVEPGCRLSGAEIGLAASIGKHQLTVSALPKAIILSTGDELVDVSEQPLPHQIRRSNTYSIQAALYQWGLESDTGHLMDDEAEIERQLRSIIDQYQLIVLSGGVSKGKFDYVPQVLEKLACKKLFHKVAQRPGKPFWFGTTPNGGCIFALPGNPVSTFMCTQRYVLPWLNASTGLPPFTGHWAELQDNFSFGRPLTCFLQVKTTLSSDARLQAWPIAGKGSGDLANLPLADGFLELPADRDIFEKGAYFPYHPYR